MSPVLADVPPLTQALTVIAGASVVVSVTVNVVAVPVVAGVTVNVGATVYPLPFSVIVKPVIAPVSALITKVPLAVTPPLICGLLKTTVAVVSYGPFAATSTATVATPCPPMPVSVVVLNEP